MLTPGIDIIEAQLGRLFAKVRFPILPQIEYPEAFDASEADRPTLLRRIFGFESAGYTGIFRMRHPTLLTPRDFDLSPYFEIVKFNVAGGKDASARGDKMYADARAGIITALIAALRVQKPVVHAVPAPKMK